MTAEQGSQIGFFQSLLDHILTPYSSSDEFEIIEENVTSNSTSEVASTSLYSWTDIAIYLFYAVVVFKILSMLCASKMPKMSQGSMDPSTKSLLTAVFQKYVRKRHEELQAMKRLLKLYQILYKNQQHDPKPDAAQWLEVNVSQRIEDEDIDLVELQTLETMLITNKVDHQRRQNETLRRKKNYMEQRTKEFEEHVTEQLSSFKPEPPGDGRHMHQANAVVHQDFECFIDDLQTQFKCFNDDWEDSLDESSLVDEAINAF